MAQFGSALEWGSRGRKFNSCHPDQQAKLSLLRAKKRRLYRRFFLLFFASLCPSQKTRQSEMRDARKCSLFRRFAPYNSCHPDHGGKTPPYLSENGFSRFLFLRQVFPYSQKVTQAELFASARFTRNNKDINVTTDFFEKLVLFCFKYVYLKKIVIFEI